MSRQRLRVDSRVIADKKTPGAVRAQVPRAVVSLLAARLGDSLVFEEGSAFVAERAAAKGTYFVVRLERAEPPAPLLVTSDAPADPAAEIEPLEDTVRRVRGY
jgi:hypothetical protein